jgi:hypothetical protein
MRITLVRHAPVRADWKVRLNRSELEAWLSAYDQAPIGRDVPPPDTLEAIHSARRVLASSLPRTRESLLLAGRAPDRCDPLFDEAPLPEGRGKGWLRLRPMEWLLLFRFQALLSGWLPGGYIRRLEARAEEGATLLIGEARNHDAVLLMGHGAMNHYLGKALRRRGWRRVTEGGTGNWGVTRFEKTPSDP